MVNFEFLLMNDKKGGGGQWLIVNGWRKNLMASHRLAFAKASSGRRSIVLSPQQGPA